MHLHWGIFALSNSRTILDNCINAINGFYTNELFHTDTDSLYNEKKLWNILNKAVLFGKSFLQGMSDYKDGGFFIELFFFGSENNVLFNYR